MAATREARCRLGLGTVQFGLDYGVANRDGQVSERDAAAILAHAERRGLSWLDTAAAYGDAESVLGCTLAYHHRFRIVTKIQPLRTASVGKAELRRAVEAFALSLARLRQPRVAGLLAHHAEDLLVPGGDALYAQMLAWKRDGLTERIGASIYDRRQADALLDRYDLDLVQLPLNLYNQRLLRDGTLARLHARGVEIHVRSALLQGVLATAPEALPPHLQGLAGHQRRFHDFLAQRGLSPLQAAFGFVRALPEADVCLAGVLSAAQLDECIDAFDSAPDDDFSGFAVGDEALIDPRTWPAR